MRSDSRLRFFQGADATSGLARFTTAEDVNATGNPPVLEIVFSGP